MEGTPYQLETHMAHTEDGFVLVLHRLVPRPASGDGAERSGSGNGNGNGNGNGKRQGGSFSFGRSSSNTVSQHGTEHSMAVRSVGQSSGAVGRSIRSKRPHLNQFFCPCPPHTYTHRRQPSRPGRTARALRGGRPCC